MKTKLLKQWKKVALLDIPYVVGEMKAVVTHPCTVILEGDLGLGKTTFCQNWIKSKDSKAQVLSPTYSLINDYGNFLHADFYRLKDPMEVLELELELNAQGKDCILIEWGKKFYPTLERELGDQYQFFMIEILLSSGGGQYRDYDLFDLERF